MCGLVGFWNLGGLPQGAESLAGRMADRIAHRGPDGAGTWLDSEAGLALAHRRLSILDLSDAGRQPMHSHCGRYVIAFNGEIYNHLDLRKRLESQAQAPAWRGHSDTETLLACFTAWGVERTLEATVGMFALSLWDRAERVLWLARDRLGEKPLYYGWQGATFLFASEPKALLPHPDFAARISRTAIALLLRYNCIPAPFSIYEGIYKLPPGQLLRVGTSQASVPDSAVPQPWWTLADVITAGIAEPFTGDVEEAIAETERVLARAVRDQMISDVPLGAFLSGGVDSSTVVALMQAATGQRVRTFTIGFEDSGFDEADHARAVAGHLGTEHHEIRVRAQDALDVVPQLPSSYCEPFADSSQIPTFLVSRLTRQHVTVALSGDGGDEVFGGYNRYLNALDTWQSMRRVPKLGRRIAAATLRAVPAVGWAAVSSLAGAVASSHGALRYAGDKAQKLASVLLVEDVPAFYRQLRTHWPNPDDVVIGAGEQAMPFADADGLVPDATPRHWMMAQDAQSYLPDDILVKVDRAAMANSLETRVPLLDHRVVEAAWRMPLEYKIRDGQGKWLLREVLYRHVPRALVERPKTGFTLPLDSWLRGPLRDWAESLLDPARLAREGFFRPDPIREAWKRHLSGRSSAHYQLWDVLMFQAWLADSARAA